LAHLPVFFHLSYLGTVQFLDKKLEGSAPKKIAKVTTPAVEAASDFDDDIPF
jgi:hypothetical protein